MMKKLSVKTAKLQLNTIKYALDAIAMNYEVACKISNSLRYLEAFIISVEENPILTATLEKKEKIK